MKAVDWHRQNFIPKLLYFQNGASFIGSISNAGQQEFRFKITPKDGKLSAEVWYGPLCYECSQMTNQSEFEMDAPGRDQMLEWLSNNYKSMGEPADGSLTESRKLGSSV